MPRLPKLPPRRASAGAASASDTAAAAASATANFERNLLIEGDPLLAHGKACGLSPHRWALARSNARAAAFTKSTHPRAGSPAGDGLAAAR
jgi:hypothetical protein